MRYTLSYSPSNEGWPSFYEFYPEMMKGMNKRFYTFKGGNLYRHNEKGVSRNLFYEGHPDFGSAPSYMKLVFNDASLETKNFKTLSLESTSPWTINCFTELERGEISESYFEKKEDSFYAYIRAIETVPVLNTDLSLRSAQGLGVVDSVDITDPENAIIVYSHRIDNILSVGDILYQGDPEFNIVGPVKTVDRENRTITVDLTAYPPPFVTATPAAGEYTMYSKNNVAESNGVRGDYLIIEARNFLGSAQEIFAISSEVFKSYT